FPSDGYQHHESDLTVAESFLPENVKTTQTDLIMRAQTEWHFVVLSTKLNRAYQSELEDFKDKIGQLTKYDSALWENLKQFWDKVREQVREKNLSRGHADALRDQTNRLFSRMKELNAKLNEEFVSKAEETKQQFETQLADIEARLQKNENLNRLFEELKEIQRNFKNAKLTRDIRTQLWNRIDAVFKAVKVKRFGPESVSGNSKLDRLKRRFEGLLNAIKRMEDSIRRDDNELKFQRRKINSSNTGQLESQIREAKVQMVQQRINSKKEKLEDMLKTKGQLESQLAKLEKAAEKKAAKEAKEAKATKEKQDPPVMVPLTKEAPKEEETVPKEKSVAPEDANTADPVKAEEAPETPTEPRPEIPNEEKPVEPVLKVVKDEVSAVPEAKEEE
ncbi:MAG: hypothetical protein AAFV80_16140, partial [Bacteroidota bacterium]